MTQMNRTPREAPKYNYAVHGQSDQGNFGNFILKEGVHALVKKPSWKGTETVFRPYPSLRYDDPTQFEPYRIDPGGRNFFGNWIRRYDCWWGAGRNATTMLISNPETQDRTYDKWASPLGVLYRAIETACKNGQGLPEWYQLREGSSQKGKALRAPAECYLMQGAILCLNSKKTYDGGKAPLGWGPNLPVILAVSQGAGKTLEMLLNEENPGFRGDPADFHGRYKYGDPVDVNSGKYIHFYEKGHDPRAKYGAKPVGPSPFASSGWGKGAASKGDKDAKDIGFDLFIDDAYDGNPAAIPPDSLDMVKQKWLFWEDILYFPTVLEQARKCFEEFPLSACMYAFEGQHNEWIPEEYRKAHYQTVSAPVPAGVPGHQQPVQQGPMQQPNQAPRGTGVWGQNPHQSNPVRQAVPQTTAIPAQANSGPFSRAGTAHTDASVPEGSFDDAEAQPSAEARGFFGSQPDAGEPAAAKKEATAATDDDAAAVARMIAARKGQ